MSMKPPSIRKAYHEALTILVVEDYMVFCKEIRHALPQHEVIFASSLSEAIEMYEKHLPNLTFLDLALPDGDGFALMDHIRKRDADAYIVILSGSKLKADIERAQQKGAQGYIIKPTPRATLLQHVEAYLDRREKSIKSLIKETQERRQDATV